MSGYGYWDWNNGSQCALVGGFSTIKTNANGRKVVVKDPDLPAVLEDEFILHALRTSQKARDDFDRLVPHLDPVSKARCIKLATGATKTQTYMVRTQEAQGDAIQKKEVKAGVHLEMPKP